MVQQAAIIKDTKITVFADDLIDVFDTALAHLDFNIEKFPKSNMLTAILIKTKDYKTDRVQNKYKLTLDWRELVSDTSADVAWDYPERPVNYLITVKVNPPENHKVTQEIIELTAKVRDEIVAAAARLNQIREQNPTVGQTGSKWANIEKLKKDDLIRQNTETDSKRLFVGTYRGHTVTVPERITNAHTIVVGVTGTGKSYGVIIPQLRERIGISAVVTEAIGGKKQKPVVFERTARYREQHGHKVYYFSTVSDETLRFNPIDTVNSQQQASELANLIMLNTTAKYHKGDQIWTQSENILLKALILYAVGLRGRGKKSAEGSNANLAYIRHLLREGPAHIAKLVEASPEPESKLEFHGFLRMTSPNFRLGVLSGLFSRLNPWSIPSIAALTEVSDFDPASLKDELFTFYLSHSVEKPEYVPVASLILSYLYGLAVNQEFKYPISLILDEFTNYGYLPNFANNITVVRNTPVPILLGIQDYSQLEEVYGQNDAKKLFGQMNTKIILRAGDNYMAQKISQLLGSVNKELRMRNSRGQTSPHLRTMPLMDISEITKIPNFKAVVLISEQDPFRVNLPTYLDYKAEAQPVYPPSLIVRESTYTQCAAPLPFEEEAEEQAKHYDPKEAQAYIHNQPLKKSKPNAKSTDKPKAKTEDKPKTVSNKSSQPEQNQEQKADKDKTTTKEEEKSKSVDPWEEFYN